MAKVPNNLLVCVVDDDESVRAGTASLLRSAGYITESFGTAEAFLESEARRRCMCVVADIQMPGMSGIDLASELGRDQPYAPVILMTARTEREILASAASCNAVCLLRKPFNADQLLECVQAASRR
jgi:FixJ family two-component response regulator